MKTNIWIIVLMSIHFSIISGLFSPKVNYSKVSFIKRDEQEEHVEYEDDYVNITYSKIKESILKLSKLNPETTSLIKLGKSCDGLEDILALAIQKPNYNPKFSNTIVLVSGTKENDWQSVFTSFYIAKNLVEYNSNLKIMFDININWLIVPILNPDLYTNSSQKGHVSKWSKNNNWSNNYYEIFLDKIKEENITMIIHLTSEKVCRINNSNYLEFDMEDKRRNGDDNLAEMFQEEKYLICNLNFQEPIASNTNASANGTFDEWIAKNMEEFRSVMILSLTILNTAPPEYNNSVELSTVLTTVKIIKKIKILFSQKYFTTIDNWPIEIDSFIHKRFPHNNDVLHGTSAKMKVHHMLLLLQFLILYVLSEIKF